MSQTNQAIIKKLELDKLDKAKNFMKQTFKTKLHSQAKMIEDLAEDKDASDRKAAKGSGIRFEGGSLMQIAKDALGDETTYLDIPQLTFECWCPVPSALWDEFRQDGGFLKEINDKFDEIVKEYARVCAWTVVDFDTELEKSIKALDKQSRAFEADVMMAQNTAKVKCREECEKLGKSFEKKMVSEIAGALTAKTKVLKRYQSYQFRVGVKFGISVAVLATGIVALATSAHPGAPAQLVPAVIAIGAASAAIAIQLGEMADDAEDTGDRIRKLCENVKIRVKIGEKKSQKFSVAGASFRVDYGQRVIQLVEFGAGFGDTVTGGITALVVPSISKMIDLAKLHKSKLDGIEATLHDLQVQLSESQKAYDAADSMIGKYEAKLENSGSIKHRALLAMIKKEYDKQKLDADIEATKVKIADFDRILKNGRKDNEGFTKQLKAAQDALKTKHFALAGELLGAAVLIGINFANGVPKPDAVTEIGTACGAIGASLADVLRACVEEVV